VRSLADSHPATAVHDKEEALSVASDQPDTPGEPFASANLVGIVVVGVVSSASQVTLTQHHGVKRNIGKLAV
jgi:hypothetical protein